jgi:hypothetical protein
VDEVNQKYGIQLRSDLKLRTTLYVCAICSERKNAGELMSVVLEKSCIPEAIQLDELGIIDMTPLGNGEYCQMFACDVCFCSGKVFMKHAHWNVHGFGTMDKSDIWSSEESFVSTIVSTISVKHSGNGGHSFKQESIGPAIFYYHNVLETMQGFVRECIKEKEVAVGWVRQGQGTNGKALMMVRVEVVLKLFVKFWSENATYQVQCLQHANGVWSIEKVGKELLPAIVKRLAKKNQGNNNKNNNSPQQHSWPWKVTDNDAKRFYVRVGQMVSMEGISEIRLFVQAFP